MRFSFAWFKENFGLVAMILGFIVDTITLGALINSNIAPSIPFIDHPFGIVVQLTIWAIAAVTYLGFLRGYWLGISRKIHTRPAETFRGFLFEDMVRQFRHPFLLIPFIVLGGFLVSIIQQMGEAFWWIAGSIVVVSFVIFYIWNEIDSSKRQWSKLRDEKIFQRWIERIEKELADVGYATDRDLEYKYSESRGLCEKALRKYHKRFEAKRDLILIQEKVRKDRTSDTTVKILVLAPRKMTIRSKPWLRSH